MTVEQDPKIIGFLTAHGWGEASFFPMTSMRLPAVMHGFCIPDDLRF